MTRSSLFVLLALGAACTDSVGNPPDGGASDAGADERDAGGDDAGAEMRDAGLLDAGLMDAGLMDAGLMDAGLLDAGLVDAGVMTADGGQVDGGEVMMMDAGPPDAAVDVDGGSDAGPLDAGPPDAGPWAPPAECDVVVPRDYATAAEAVANAPSPGTVCLAPGTHGGTGSAIVMRAHVNLSGAGMGLTTLQSELSLAGLGDADPSPTVVSDLTLDYPGQTGVHLCESGASCGTLNITADIAIALSRVALRARRGVGTTYCMNVSARTYDGSQIAISMVDSVCAATRGVRVLGGVASSGGSYDLTFERNRFRPGGDTTSIAWPIDFNVCSEDMAAGSRINALVRDNTFEDFGYAAVDIYQCGNFVLSADERASEIVVAHNTMVGNDLSPFALNIVRYRGARPRSVVVNNLFYRVDPGIYDDNFANHRPDTEAGNLLAATSPFVDVDGGDLHLLPASPAIDAATGAWVGGSDIDGIPRPQDGDGDGSATSDVGAHEYVP